MSGSQKKTVLSFETQDAVQHSITFVSAGSGTVASTFVKQKRNRPYRSDLQRTLNSEWASSRLNYLRRNKCIMHARLKSQILCLPLLFTLVYLTSICLSSAQRIHKKSHSVLQLQLPKDVDKQTPNNKNSTQRKLITHARDSIPLSETSNIMTGDGLLSGPPFVIKRTSKSDKKRKKENDSIYY